MNSLILRLSALLWFAAATVLPAQVPTMINYQGRVAVSGTSFSGVGQFNFSFINGDGSQTYWQSNGVAINVVEGLFTVRLGDISLPNMAAVPADVFTDPTHTDVRLRVAFNDGTRGFQTVAPDTRMLAVPYALAAKTAEFGFPSHAQEFKVPGTSTFTVPEGVTKILAEVWGGGGGANEEIVGEGGGPSTGAYSRKTISVTPGTALAVTVGTAGETRIYDFIRVPVSPEAPYGEIAVYSGTVRSGGESKITTDGNVVLCKAAGGPIFSGPKGATPPLAPADPNADLGRGGQRGDAITGTVSPPHETGDRWYGALSTEAQGGYVLLQW
jgi:hypothetical protein